MTASHGKAKISTLFLILTSLTCGTLIMAIEVLGSRVIGPFFGVSLFIWTSIIAVAMVALAGGYALGGILCDRHGTPSVLYSLIMTAGILTLLIPVLKSPIIKLCIPLGLRAGAFMSSLLLFAPPLMLLGMVSPFVIKLATREMKSIGRTVGLFYAISTIGSVLGTAITGFVLVAYIGVNNIFLLIGTLLIALSATYFIFFHRRYLAAAALCIPLLFLNQPDNIVRILPGGTQASLKLNKDSHYANLKVVDYQYGSAHTRELLLDGIIQGGLDLNNGLSLYEYTYFLEMLPAAIRPGADSALVVGLGAGLVPRWFEKIGIKTDIIEIDPDVVAIAEEYFDFKVSGDIYVSDARQHFLNSSKTYDYLILDAFGGETAPSHLLSIEASRLAKSKLNPGGVLGLNMIGTIGEESFMTASVIKTLKEVFDNVQIFPITAPDSKLGNLIVMAYDGQPETIDPAIARTHDIHPMAQQGVFQFFGRPFEFPENTPAIILTDDYNPLDCYDYDLKLLIRKLVLEHNHWDILLAERTAAAARKSV